MRTSEEKAARYAYVVEWSEEDHAYLGRVQEWRSLVTHGDTPADALAEIMSMVEFAIDDCEAAGDDYPEPFADRRYSGKFNVRITPELHRSLVKAADSEGVSLNHYVSTVLARATS